MRTTHKPTTCLYTLSQVKASELLTPERMAEVEHAVEARIQPVILSNGKQLPDYRFVEERAEFGTIYRVADEFGMEYARRQALFHVLTEEELVLINNNCLQAQCKLEEERRIAAATKITEWDGHVFWNERYYQSVEDALEDAEFYNKTITHLWPAAGHAVVTGITAGDIAEQFIERNGWEEMGNADLEGLDDLQTALTKFEEANAAIVSYEPDYSKVLILPSHA